MPQDFERLINDALAQDFSGWDFSYLHGRWQEEPPLWSYRECVVARVAEATSLLDMGTGGGEFLASLPQHPNHTCATENYPPNIPVARARLEPLGIQVYTLERDEELPFDDHTFDLIINRHESYAPSEVYRVLKPGGRFLTQQVGSRDNVALNRWFDAATGDSEDAWSLAVACADLARVGFAITTQHEAHPQTVFNDVGAVVYYLKVISWQIPGFDVHSDRERLLALHEHIQKSGGFISQSHRFFLEAVKA